MELSQHSAKKLCHKVTASFSVSFVFVSSVVLTLNRQERIQIVCSGHQTKSNDRCISLGEENLAWDILDELSHAERFDMVLLFLSSKDKKGENVFAVDIRVHSSPFLTG